MEFALETIDNRRMTSLLGVDPTHTIPVVASGQGFPAPKTPGPAGGWEAGKLVVARFGTHSEKGSESDGPGQPFLGSTRLHPPPAGPAINPV